MSEGNSRRRAEPIRISPENVAVMLDDGSWVLQSGRQSDAKGFVGSRVTGAYFRPDGAGSAVTFVVNGEHPVELANLTFLQVNYYTIVVRGTMPSYAGIRNRAARMVFVQPEHRDLVRREQLERNEERLHIQGLLHEKAVADTMARKSHEAMHHEAYEGQLLVPPHDFAAQLKRGTCMVRHGLSAVPLGMAGQIVVDASLEGDKVRIVTLAGALDVATDRICSPRGQSDIHVLQWNEVVTSKPKMYGGGQRVSRLYGTSVVLRDLAWHLKQPNPYRYQQRIEEAHAEYKRRADAAAEG